MTILKLKSVEKKRIIKNIKLVLELGRVDLFFLYILAYVCVRIWVCVCVSVKMSVCF